MAKISVFLVMCHYNGTRCTSHEVGGKIRNVRGSTLDGTRWGHDEFCHCLRVLGAWTTRETADKEVEALRVSLPQHVFYSLEAHVAEVGDDMEKRVASLVESFRKYVN